MGRRRRVSTASGICPVADSRTAQWRPTELPGGGMECQWCGRERPLADCRYDDKGRWRWPGGASEEAA